MPYILFYADSRDLKLIEEYLNQHPELAFIVPDGAHRWRAVQNVPGLRRQSVALWHVPSGPLPLLHAPPNDKEEPIPNPWRGWKELRSGADRSVPYFGAGHPGIIWLNRKPRGIYQRTNIGMSSFEWIENFYSVRATRARKATEAFWKDLRGWVKANATLVPRKGRVNGPRRDIWAFPSALAAFKRGQGRDPDWI